MSIKIERIDPTTFTVTVHRATTTTHRVTVSLEYWRKLTGGQVDAEKLVEDSFEFLLARESNTSIMRTFDLPVIQQFFPEFEHTIQQKLN